MLEPPNSASPSLAARGEIGAESSSLSRPSTMARKTISAVRILVVDAGDIGASAFLANRVAPSVEVDQQRVGDARLRLGGQRPG